MNFSLVAYFFKPVLFFIAHTLSDHANATNVKMLLSFAYGVAGDVFMVLAEKWDDFYVKFHEGFNNEGSEVDEIIAKSVEDIVDESMREWSLKVHLNNYFTCHLCGSFCPFFFILSLICRGLLRAKSFGWPYQVEQNFKVVGQPTCLDFPNFIF